MNSIYRPVNILVRDQGWNLAYRRVKSQVSFLAENHIDSETFLPLSKFITGMRGQVESGVWNE